MSTVVLDAGVVIGALDSADGHHRASVAALGELDGETLVLPASVLAEVLVHPYSRGAGAVRTVEHFLTDLRVRVEPLDAAGAHAAARLRASHPTLRLPDALTVAKAAVLGGRVLTTDSRWPSGLGVAVHVLAADVFPEA